MTEFDILKLRSVLLFIISKRGSIDIFHLFKILYFADREHMAKYGRRIINDTFFALENGPVPSLLYDIINAKSGKKKYMRRMDDCKIIFDSFDCASGDASHIIYSDQMPDESYLSKSDKKCLDDSFNENINLPFLKLSDNSHDCAWYAVWKKNGKKSNPMDPYLSAKAAGATDDLIDYMREMDEFQSMLMS